MRPITAADVMNPRVLSVPAEWSLTQLADFLVEHEISGAPVTDTAGRLVGVVSVTDIAAALATQIGAVAARGEEGPRAGSDFFRSAWPEGPRRDTLEDLAARGERRTVGEIMTPGVYTVHEETPVSEIAETLIEEHVHRIFVVRDEKVVGIVSTSDLLGLLVEEDE